MGVGSSRQRAEANGDEAEDIAEDVIAEELHDDNRRIRRHLLSDEAGARANDNGNILRHILFIYHFWNLLILFISLCSLLSNTLRHFIIHVYYRYR